MLPARVVIINPVVVTPEMGRWDSVVFLFPWRDARAHNVVLIILLLAKMSIVMPGASLLGGLARARRS